MPIDPHLFEGEGERFRRYGRFALDPIKQTLELFEHDLFFQAKKFDQLYGDIHRQFAPMTYAEFGNDFFQQLMIESFFAMPIPIEHSKETFEVSAHMIRISATPNSNIGRPAPEGIHRDGYHFGSIHLMQRENVEGADNQIYDLNKNLIDESRLLDPMDSIYFDDGAIFHAVTPFAAEDRLQRATRDMLILLYQPLTESPQKETRKRMLREF